MPVLRISSTDQINTWYRLNEIKYLMGRGWSEKCTGRLVAIDARCHAKTGCPDNELPQYGLCGVW